MPALHDLQQAFGASLLLGNDAAIAEHVVEDSFSAAERLRVYRNTCRFVLTEALRITYPAIDRLVGRDFFDMVAERFIPKHPPRSGYLNEYGGEFADFLETLPSAMGLRYLPDVARFEWALSMAANAIDASPLDPGALVDVARDQHAALRFEPHPSVRLLSLSYPADLIADTVLSGDDEAMASVDLSTGPVWLVVHRGPDGIEAQRVDPTAYRFIQRLCAGEPLGSLLEAAVSDIEILLAEQFTKGRLTGFRLGASNQEEETDP